MVIISLATRCKPSWAIARFQFFCQPETYYESIGRSQIVKRDNVEALSLRHNHQFRDLKSKNVLKGRTYSTVLIKELP
jgi:hypothetical protein